MASIRRHGSGGTVTVVAGISAAGRSINGCVFFISTAGLAGGSAKTVMHSVSFFGAGVVITAGFSAAAARVREGESRGEAGGFGGGRVGK